MNKVPPSLVIILVFLTYGIALLPVTKANIITKEGTTASYQPYISYPRNTSYSTVNVLNVSFRAEVWGNVKYSMNYSLDGKENQTLPLVDHYFSWIQGEHDKSYVDGSVILPELAQGSHNIRVFLECNWQIGYSTGWKDNYYYDSEEVYFTINNSITYQSPTPIPTSSPTPNTTPTLTSSPTNTPTQTPILSPSPTIPEFPFWIISSTLLIITLVMVLSIGKKSWKR